MGTVAESSGAAPRSTRRKGIAKLRPWTTTTSEFGPQILTGAPKPNKLGAFTTPGQEVALGQLLCSGESTTRGVHRLVKSKIVIAAWRVYALKDNIFLYRAVDKPKHNFLRRKKICNKQKKVKICGQKR